MISINKPNGDMYARVDIQDNWLRLHLAALPHGTHIAVDKKILPMLIDALIQLKEEQEE